MSKLSEKAFDLGMALFLDASHANDGMSAAATIAVALQKLMDERDEARIRAEAAETRLAELVDRVRDWIGPEVFSTPSLELILRDYEVKP